MTRVLVCLLLLLSACSPAPSPTASPTPPPSPVASPPSANSPSPGLASEAPSGVITVEYEVPKDESHREVYEILKDNGLFEELCESIQDEYLLPQDLRVVFTECDEENAFYDPEAVEITMCYELIDRYRLAFTDEESSAEEVERETIYAALFTFYHELGHALVHLLELPITGREEDVVDEFAAITLIHSDTDEGMDAVMAGIQQFAMDAEESEGMYERVDELPFWDVHSLDQQRFYDLMCMLYGSDPERYADLVKEQELPEERAELCEDEYVLKADNWDRLLAPHRREAPAE